MFDAISRLRHFSTLGLSLLSLSNGKTVNGIFRNWNRTFIEFSEFSEFRESDKPTKHELGLV